MGNTSVTKDGNIVVVKSNDEVANTVSIQSTSTPSVTVTYPDVGAPSNITKDGNTVVVKSIDGTATTVIVQQPDNSIVSVNTPGPQGPPGAQGSAGNFDAAALVTTGSFNTFTASYYLDSSSFANRINNINVNVDLSGYTATSSFNAFTSSYKTDSASFANRINNVTFDTSSLVSTASFNTFTSSYKTDSASFNTSITNLISATSSYVLKTQTSSFVVNSQTSSFVDISKTASFATTGSNIFKGTQTVHGNMFMSGSFPLVYSNNSSNNILFGHFDGSTIHGPYLQIFGNQYPNISQRGGAEIVYDIRNGGDANFHVASFNGSTWIQKFRVDDISTQITGSLNVTNGITGSLYGTSSWAQNYNETDPIFVSKSGSYITTESFNTFTDLYKIDSASFNNRIDSLTNSTSSYVLNYQTSSFATLTSNTFNGNQIVSGSLVVTGDVTIFGSSSLIYLTASQLNVGTNVISVNIFEPAQRFGGLQVYDSGSLSHQATASLLWDSQNNHWIYQNASGSLYNGGMLLSGPRNLGSLGDEPTLTANFIVKSQGGDHITTSSLFDNGTLVRINNNTQITGSLDVLNGITGSLIGTSSWASVALRSNVVLTTDDPLEYIVFTNGAGNQTLRSNFNLVYNSITNAITASTFRGNLVGNSTGTASYSSYSNSTKAAGSTGYIQFNTNDILNATSNLYWNNDAIITPGLCIGYQDTLQSNGIFANSGGFYENYIAAFDPNIQKYIYSNQNYTYTPSNTIHSFIGNVNITGSILNTKLPSNGIVYTIDNVLSGSNNFQWNNDSVYIYPTNGTNYGYLGYFGTFANDFGLHGSGDNPIASYSDIGYHYSNDLYRFDLNTLKHRFINDVNITGSLNVSSSIVGNLIGTSSYALTASYALNAGGTGVATLIDTLGARIYTDDTFITAGSKGYKHIAYNADIIKTRTIANTNGNIDINIKRNNVTLGTISLSNQSSSLDTTLTGWTTQLNTNDLIEFYVSQSSTYITDITIFIDIQSR